MKEFKFKKPSFNSTVIIGVTISIILSLFLSITPQDGPGLEGVISTSAAVFLIIFIIAVVISLTYTEKKEMKVIKHGALARSIAPPDCILVINASTPKFYGLQGMEKDDQLVFTFDGFTCPEGQDAYVQSRLFWQEIKKTYPKGSVITMDCYLNGVHSYSH